MQIGATPAETSGASIPRSWDTALCRKTKKDQVPQIVISYPKEIVISILEITPGYPMEGLILKMKFQYFGHLMGRANSLGKTLMLGRIEGRRRRG